MGGGQVEEPAPALLPQLHGGQRLHGLLTGHGVQRAVLLVGEAAVRKPEVHQRFCHVALVLLKALICRGVDVQRRQRQDHLRAALAALGAPAFKAAGDRLGRRQGIQRRVDNLLILLPIGSQRLQGHGGDVHIHGAAAKGEAAVGQLGGDDGVEHVLTAVPGVGGHFRAYRVYSQ